MNKLQFYRYAALFLLILNVGMLVFFFTTKPPHNGKPPHHPIARQNTPNHGVDLLKMDKEQHEEFLSIAQAHGALMDSISEEQRKILIQYFNNTNQIEDSLLFEVFYALELSKLASTRQHFEDVKSILSEDQLENFERFRINILDRILMGKKNNPMPPKDFR